MSRDRKKKKGGSSTQATAGAPPTPAAEQPGSRDDGIDEARYAWLRRVLWVAIVAAVAVGAAGQFAFWMMGVDPN